MAHRHTPHTRCHKGKRVLVGLRDGAVFPDHFEASGSSWVQFRAAGKLPKKVLRFMMIWRKESDG